MSKGVNHLIKQGAMLVDSPTDVVEDIFSESLVKPKKRRRKKIAANKEDLNLPPSEMRIIGFLGNEPTHMDEIIRKNDMKISETIHVLGELVNKNLVECIEKSYYVLK
jgi:DNA processing protein